MKIRTWKRFAFAACAASITVLSAAFALPAQAHETKCPYCKLPVAQDTKEQDNEVALRYGRKRIEYRSVWCAMADVNRGTYKDADLTILAPSEKKAQPVVIERKGGKWNAPAGAVFVAANGSKPNHKVCHITYRAFTGKAAFDGYVKKNSEMLKDAKPVTLEQMLAFAK